MIVKVKDFEEMQTVARSPQGQLACTLHLGAVGADQSRALALSPGRKASRVLANG